MTHPQRKQAVLDSLKAQGMHVHGTRGSIDIVGGHHALAIQVGTVVSGADISYFANVASRYAILIFVADTFLPDCARQSKKLGVLLCTMEEFTEVRYRNPEQKLHQLNVLLDKPPVTEVVQ